CNSWSRTSGRPSSLYSPLWKLSSSRGVTPQDESSSTSSSCTRPRRLSSTRPSGLACLSGILAKFPTTLLDYKFPLYSDIAGCLMLMFSLGLIPVWAVTWLRRQNFNCDDALQPSYKWGPEEPPIFNAYQARLRNRGLVAMTSLFPVRYVAPKIIPPDAAVTVVFAAEPARAPTDQPGDNLEDVARFWALPPNLPGLDLSRMAVSLPRVGDDAGRRADVSRYQVAPAPERVPPGRERTAYPPESGPSAPSSRKSSLPGIPGNRYRPAQRPPRPLVSNFLPTLHPNTLGPQFSESPMRFGLLGRMFVRRHDESDEVLIPGIPVQPPGPCLNPLPPPVRYPTRNRPTLWPRLSFRHFRRFPPCLRRRLMRPSLRDPH
ncbi:unnamed protein product, partial [Ixodes pacificus]